MPHPHTSLLIAQLRALAAKQDEWPAQSVMREAADLLERTQAPQPTHHETAEARAWLRRHAQLPVLFSVLSDGEAVDLCERLKAAIRSAV
jgi:hypothetical protein